MNKKYFFFLIFILSNAFANAQEMKPLANTAEFFNKLKTVSKTTTSIQADFTDEKNLSYLKEPQKSGGVFYYKKDDKIRWEQKQPFQYIIMINGDKIKIHWMVVKKFRYNDEDERAINSTCCKVYCAGFHYFIA